MSRSVEGTYRRCEDGRLVVRFAAGEEAAREFLERGPEGADLRRGTMRALVDSLPMSAVYFVYGGLGGVLACLILFILDHVSASWIALGGLGFGVFCALLSSVLFAVGAIIAGPFVVSRQRTRLRWHRRVVSFEALGLLRRTSITSEDAENPELVDTTEVVEIEVADGDPLQIGGMGYEEPSLDQLADTINEMLAQYHERRAIRQWLAQREAERSAQTGPYRGDETPRDRGTSRPS